eukprot:TRINITY_DN4453_c0_g2_i4.p1 TRINITY_DN4453_c0_g2~~TRINITY_DN4453_c0_g2_i4.p1  ORF type:complete len:330 (+),score=48.59 TRINITY_DN4453_c0_g2_i4:33-992(+)
MYDDLIALKRDNIRIVGKADQLTAAERELKRRLEYFEWDYDQPDWLVHTATSRRVARRSAIQDLLRDIHASVGPEHGTADPHRLLKLVGEHFYVGRIDNAGITFKDCKTFIKQTDMAIPRTSVHMTKDGMTMSPETSKRVLEGAPPNLAASIVKQQQPSGRQRISVDEQPYPQNWAYQFETRYLEIWNAHDSEALKSCFTVDCEFIYPLRPGQLGGREYFLANVSRTWQTISDVRMVAVQHIAAADSKKLWTQIALISAKMPGAGFQVFEFREGLIQRATIMSERLTPEDTMATMISNALASSAPIHLDGDAHFSEPFV